MKSGFYALAGCTLLLTSACAQMPKDVLQVTEQHKAMKAAQSRTIASPKKKEVLLAGAAALQDMGFSIDKTDPELGLVVGSKQRDAKEGEQVALAVVGAAITTILAGPVAGVHNFKYDDEQFVRASITAGSEENATDLRISVQRIVLDQRGDVSKAETVKDEKLYSQFYETLGASIPWEVTGG
ncbi:hypothetical protein GCM10007094_28780 [Pseudovibrio japonicus]|uniref:Lipoprotein n=1 Tax=Pseudovibrio japonicus TaxID=366534 RepID=A0ABQ3ELZ0_9HYPH|nr:hypothetical protein [Pseudovibrio japonicus]GHB37698.1 hypothetical protein GCM10007094_28780 [Pseudovibrio japonicus]